MSSLFTKANTSFFVLGITKFYTQEINLLVLVLKFNLLQSRNM